MPSDAKPILLVDSDSKSRRVLEVSLRKAGYDVVGVESSSHALGTLGERAFGLVIFDTTLKDEDGYDFCAKAKSIEGIGQIPFIALSQSHDMASKLRGFELGVDDYIAKPVYLKEVISRARLLLERRGKEQLVESELEQVGGDLGDFSVVDILQTLEEGEKTGALRLESGDERITIYFENGRPVDASSGSISAEEAVYRALSWDEGSYTLKYLPTVRRPRTIEGSFNDLVVEGLQRSEQMDQLVKDLGSFKTVMKVDYSRISEMTDNMPPEVDEIVGLIDGRRNVRSVVCDSSLGDLESLQVIKRLSDTGVLAAVAPPTGADDDEFEQLSWDSSGTVKPETDLVTWLTGDFEAVFPPPLGAEKRAERQRQQRKNMADRAAEEALRLERERAAKEEEERKAREEAERKAREEEERKAREVAERKAREEEERLRNELSELFEMRKSEEETLRRAEEERQAAEQRTRELEAREEQIVRRLTGEHSTLPQFPMTDMAAKPAAVERKDDDGSDAVEEERVAALEQERIEAIEQARVAALEDERRLALEAAKAAERARLGESSEAKAPEEDDSPVHQLQAPVSPVLGPSGTIRVTPPTTVEEIKEPTRASASPPPIPADEATEAVAEVNQEQSASIATAPEPEDEQMDAGEGDEFDGFFKRDDSDLFSALYPEGQEEAPSSNRKPVIIAAIITLFLAIVLILTFNNGNGQPTTAAPTDSPEDEVVADDNADDSVETEAVEEAAADDSAAEPTEPTEAELAEMHLDAVQSGANFVELALRRSDLEVSAFGSEEDLAAFELVGDETDPPLDEPVAVVATEETDEEEDDRRRDRDDDEEEEEVVREARNDDDDEEDAPDVERALERGRRQYDRGNYGEATAELRQVIDADPRNGEALDLLGRALYEMGDTRDAVVMLERATRANRRNAELLLWLGSAQEELNDPAGARESYERFLELSPEGDRADEVRQILEERL